MAFFIGIACPWLLIAVLDRIAEGRRSAELSALGITPQPAPAQSSYLVPDRPYRRRGAAPGPRRSGAERYFFGSGAVCAAGGRVGALDLGLRAELQDHVLLRLADQVLVDLLLELVEGWLRLGPLLLDLDHVPAELGLDRVGDLAGLHREGGVGEVGHHPLLGEPAEIAALGLRARVLRRLGGDLGEILAALDARGDLLGLGLVVHQDVARVHLLLGLHQLDGLVVDRVLRLGRDRALGLLLQVVVEQELVAEIGELALELRRVADLGGLGGLRTDAEVDHVVDEQVLLLRLVDAGQRQGRVIGRDGEVALGDRLAVDARHDRVRARRGGRRRGGGRRRVGGRRRGLLGCLGQRQSRHRDHDGERADAPEKGGVRHTGEVLGSRLGVAPDRPGVAPRHRWPASGEKASAAISPMPEP